MLLELFLERIGRDKRVVGRLELALGGEEPLVPKVEKGLTLLVRQAITLAIDDGRGGVGELAIDEDVGELLLAFRARLDRLHDLEYGAARIGLAVRHAFEIGRQR